MTVRPSPTRIVNGLTGLGLAIVTVVSFTHRTDPQPSGLFTTLGIGWYLGLAVIVCAAVLAKKAGANPAFPILSLAGVVVYSQALTYGSPAVMSAARHVGFVDFIRDNGGAEPQLDIYQAWSGLFAGVAFLCDAAGISDPMILATWWPVLLSPALALAVAGMASSWLKGTYRIWFAAAAFALTSTLNIIYFSPQSLGLLLAIVIFALATTPRSASRVGSAGLSRHLIVPDWSQDPPVKRAKGVGQPLQKRIAKSLEPLGPWRVAAICYMSCVMAVTHQISPYLTAGALLVLALLGHVRPWWIAIVVLIPAVTWALINRGVLGGFVSLGAVGRFWDNVQPPEHSFAQFAQPWVTRAAFYLPALVLFLMGVIALTTVAIKRDRNSVALLLVAASPAALFVATDYGQEGIFRAALFAGPWLAVLAAGLPWRRGRWTMPALTVALVVLLGVNIFGQTALDWNRVIRRDTSLATEMYERTAQDGAIMLATGTINATPLGITGRYTLTYISRESIGGYPPVDEPYDATADVATMTKRLVRDRPSRQYYALVSDSIGAYDERYGYQYYSDYLKLSDAMNASQLWRPIFQGRTTTMYILKDPVALEKP